LHIRIFSSRQRSTPSGRPSTKLLTRCTAVGISLCFLSTVATGQPDSDIARVEGGLLPIAATRVGAPVDVRDRMRAYGVPGLGIAVVDHGKLAWAKGYGMADTREVRRSRE